RSQPASSHSTREQSSTSRSASCSQFLASARGSPRISPCAFSATLTRSCTAAGVWSRRSSVLESPPRRRRLRRRLNNGDRGAPTPSPSSRGAWTMKTKRRHLISDRGRVGALLTRGREYQIEFVSATRSCSHPDPQGARLDSLIDRADPICHGLPPVATTGLDKGSIVCYRFWRQVDANSIAGLATARLVLFSL